MSNIVESLYRIAESNNERKYGTVSNPRMMTSDEIRKLGKEYSIDYFKQSHTIPEAEDYVKNNFPNSEVCINIDAYSNVKPSDITPDKLFILTKKRKQD